MYSAVQKVESGAHKDQSSKTTSIRYTVGYRGCDLINNANIKRHTTHEMSNNFQTVPDFLKVKIYQLSKVYQNQMTSTSFPNHVIIIYIPSKTFHSSGYQLKKHHRHRYRQTYKFCRLDSIQPLIFIDSLNNSFIYSLMVTSDSVVLVIFFQSDCLFLTSSLNLSPCG